MPNTVGYSDLLHRRPMTVIYDIKPNVRQKPEMSLGTRLLHPDTLEVQFVNDFLEIRGNKTAWILLQAVSLKLLRTKREKRDHGKKDGAARHADVKRRFRHADVDFLSVLASGKEEPPDESRHEAVERSKRSNPKEQSFEQRDAGHLILLDALQYTRKKQTAVSGIGKRPQRVISAPAPWQGWRRP